MRKNAPGMIALLALILIGAAVLQVSVLTYPAYSPEPAAAARPEYAPVELPMLEAFRAPHAILVLDVSGSMQTSDPDHCEFEAARQFYAVYRDLSKEMLPRGDSAQIALIVCSTLAQVVDWDGSGQDGIGLYSQATSMFYLRESTHLQGPSDQGFADRSFMYGSANGNQLPLVGSWTSGVGPVTTDVPATSGTAVHSTETFPAVITSIRLTAPATQSPTADDSAADSTTATDLQQVQSASGDVTSGTAQSQTIDAQTLDRLDLSTVLRNMPGLHDLDAVADDLLGGAGANAAHTDAVLAS